jgi:hypothetical protein
MKFSEIVDQASALLQQKGRSTYRALKLEFGLNDEQLEALKDELLFAHPEILDESGSRTSVGWRYASSKFKACPEPSRRVPGSKFQSSP